MDGLSSGATPLTVTLKHLDGYAEVVLIGDLDTRTAPELLDVVDRLVKDDDRDLRFNCSGLRFLDASGVGTLVDARRRLAERGGGLTLSSVHGLPERVLAICGLLEVFSGCHSATSASPPAGAQP